MIKYVYASCAAIVSIFGIARYAAAFPKSHAKQRAVHIIANNKQGKNYVNW